MGVVNTPIYELLFDLECSLCERFQALTPFQIRREKAKEVFLLIKRLNKKNKENFKKKNKKKVIRRPAGDNWF